MPKYPVVRYKGKAPYVRPTLRAVADTVRMAYRFRNFYNNVRKRKATNQIVRFRKGRRLNAPTTTSKRKRKQYQSVTARQAGTTRTTSQMMVRRTPRQQKFLRKLFKTNPVKIKHINRFGFNWIGAEKNNKTIWYSVTHLKFNNLCKYMKQRIMGVTQQMGGENTVTNSQQAIGNNPASKIYVGKCTYMYELYNPTNYIVTVYIYDLVCKHDTPYGISYSDAESINCSPEACMHTGSMSFRESPNTPSWVVGDPTWEHSIQGEEYDTVVWNTVGMKPTDYQYFNTFWKVKAMKKIILPPASTHHHNVIYNPKKIVTLGSLIYPRSNLSALDKNGIAGITQSTLFGFEGQLAAEGRENSDSTNVGTLPGKVVVKCIRKANIWNVPLVAPVIYSETDLKQLSEPMLFTDLSKEEPDDV
jgi:hypothetical protein